MDRESIISDIKLVVNNSYNLVSQIQQKFLESNLYDVTNSALDLGIKIIAPDLIEEQLIEIKDSIFENGLKSGLEEVVNSIVDFGKSALGIVTGNFESISQIQLAVKNGGIIDSISDLLDKAIDVANKKGLITNEIKKEIKKGKNKILKNISENISESLDNQINALEKIEKYNEKWQECFENKDFNGMKNAYNNIQKYLKEVIPLETTLKNARKLENIHNLIKNNGGNFDLSQDELDLAEAL